VSKTVKKALCQIQRVRRKTIERGETRQIAFGVSTLRLNQSLRRPSVLHPNNPLTKLTSTGEPLFSRFFKALLSGDTVTIIRGTTPPNIV
jgi:hypothetical protein